MGRFSSVDSLPTEQFIAVQRCIRAHRYLHLDKMQAELSKAGIRISRSALHRYVHKQRENDALAACGDEGTVVTIIERESGRVMVIKCAASADAIASLLASCRPQSSCNS